VVFAFLYRAGNDSRIVAVGLLPMAGTRLHLVTIGLSHDGSVKRPCPYSGSGADSN
jgi:hypothetical protein